MESIFNWITDKLHYILNIIMMMLPDSPFQDVLTMPQEVMVYIGYINYFIPLAGIVAVLGAWITAITIFYVYQLILRWAKAIE